MIAELGNLIRRATRRMLPLLWNARTLGVGTGDPACCGPRRQIWRTAGFGRLLRGSKALSFKSHCRVIASLLVAKNGGKQPVAGRYPTALYRSIDLLLV